MSYPKVSIITINFNDKEGLESTIQSVLEKDYPNIEYIIIDGGSSDGSKEVIKKYADKISYWISEKDAGIYDGQNKGIKKATGDFLLFLNSGDRLHETFSIQSIQPYMNEYDILYGDTIHDAVKDKNYKPHSVKYDTPIDLCYFVLNTLPHQATFIRKTILEKCGGNYDLSYPISADWKVFIEAFHKHGARFKYLDTTVCYYDYTGSSSSMRAVLEIHKEHSRYFKDNIPELAGFASKIIEGYWDKRLVAIYESILLSKGVKQVVATKKILRKLVNKIKNETRANDSLYQPDVALILGEE